MNELITWHQIDQNQKVTAKMNIPFINKYNKFFVGKYTIVTQLGLEFY